MQDIVKQVALLIFGAVVSTVLASGVGSLRQISDDIQRLNTSLAVILEKLADHDRRLGWLEKN